MKIGIITAMKKEFDLVAGIMDNPKMQKIKQLEFLSGKVNDKDVVLMQCGIGKVNAAIKTAEMINNFCPDCIVNVGVAGGLDKSLSVADVVIGETTSYHDVWCGEGNEIGQVQGLPTKYTADEKLLQKAKNIKNDTKIHKGLIVSGDKFVTSKEELDKIKADFENALAVDMESCAIAQTCYIYKIPFLATRIISDTVGIENHYKQYNDFWTEAPKISLNIIKQILD